LFESKPMTTPCGLSSPSSATRAQAGTTAMNGTLTLMRGSVRVLSLGSLTSAVVRPAGKRHQIRWAELTVQSAQHARID
jgi:hypothetical protein